MTVDKARISLTGRRSKITYKIDKNITYRSLQKVGLLLHKPGREFYDAYSEMVVWKGLMTALHNIYTPT